MPPIEPNSPSSQFNTVTLNAPPILIKTNPLNSRNIHKVVDCAKSLNGRCFYLIGLEQTYTKQYAWRELNEVVSSNTIFVNDLPEHVNAVELFLSELLTASERNTVCVKIAEAESAFQLLRDNPKALIYCGQNFRFISRQRNEVVEVVKFNECPLKLQQGLELFSENCFVVNRAFGKYVGLDKLRAHCEASQKKFAKKCHDPKKRNELIEQMSSRINDYEMEEKEFEEAMQQVLIQTYSSK